MEAKSWQETVMSLKEMQIVVAINHNLPMGRVIAEEQAEISFKAGKQEGRREVAEWVEEKADLIDRGHRLLFWEAKLKEWGVP